MKINCVIIDDEPLARNGIIEYASRIPFMNVVGSYEQPLLATSQLNNEQIDLLFLDIEMPVITGLDFLSSIEKPPLTIIITAYPDFALKGFELSVFDYLLKPVSFNRFLTSCNRASEYFSSRIKSGQDVFNDFFFIKSDLKYHKIVVEHILFVEALQNYVAIHTITGKHIAHYTMKYMESRLPDKIFIRIHNSYLVNINHVDAIEGNALHIDKKILPISRDRRDEKLEKILNGRFLKG